MADTRNPQAWTEGLYVRTVPGAHAVSIDYCIKEDLSDPAVLSTQQEFCYKARTFLESRGYVFNEYGHIACERK